MTVATTITATSAWLKITNAKRAETTIASAPSAAAAPPSLTTIPTSTKHQAPPQNMLLLSSDYAYMSCNVEDVEKSWRQQSPRPRKKDEQKHSNTKNWQIRTNGGDAIEQQYSNTTPNYSYTNNINIIPIAVVATTINLGPIQPNLHTHSSLLTNPNTNRI